MINDTKSVLLKTLSNLSTHGFSAGIDFKDRAPRWAHSAYSQPWIDSYVDHQLIKSDPTVTHGEKYSGHWTWDELAEIYPSATVFEAAAKFGLENGNTLSMRVNGAVLIASCSGAKWDKGELAQARAALSGLYYLHTESPSQTPVTPRSLDVLRLMCDGLRDQDIADKLGVKLETVRKRRTLALTSTETTTAPQCIRLLIKNDWL